MNKIRPFDNANLNISDRAESSKQKQQIMSSFTVITLFFLAANLYVADAFWYESPDERYHIEFHVYNRKKTTPDILTYGDEVTLLFSSFKKKPRTIMYIHGWMGSENTEGGHMIRDAYLKAADCNVILVDWSRCAINGYISASVTVSEIGKRIARMINWLVKHNRIDLQNLHIIGFSLGAHVAGFTGKALAPLKVSRITGLDPAGPGFIDSNSYERIDKTDAKFVDIIHTESQFLGMVNPIGHVDFYPNWGHDQSSCEYLDVKCCHSMAYKFYAQSISNPARFIGIRCDLNGETFENCRKEGNTVMGHGANPHVHGIFFVNPN